LPHGGNRAVRNALFESVRQIAAPLSSGVAGIETDIVPDGGAGRRRCGRVSPLFLAPAKY
jgi:hypothetical protein